MKRATHSLSCLWGLISISIHALVKRATDGKLLPKQIKGDFNPRPREEGDRQFPGLTRSYRYFNPRPREEGDLFIDYIVPNLCISIHALVKRATHRLSLLFKELKYFNPRPREEGDLIKGDQNEILTIFQSTPS